MEPVEIEVKGVNADGDEVTRVLRIKPGNKRNVVVGGPALGQRFPVTLYAPSWLVIIDHIDEIKQFIEDNRDELSWERT